MEILIIYALIAGLLISWFLLMRVEVTTFIERILNLDSSGHFMKPGHLQAGSTIHVVSTRQAPPSSAADSPGETDHVERKAPGADGGVPLWVIGE